MRSKLIVTAIAVLLFKSVLFADNPIVQTLYTADPAPMVYGEKMYVYTSHDEDILENNFFTMKDWRSYSSSDMVNWTDHGMAASIEAFSWAGTNGAWAPQCINRNGKFYMYCPIHMRGIGVLVSDNPHGPFTDPLGKALINNSGADIDPTVFIDDDGQAYLYWGNPDLYYVKLNEDMISYSGSIQQINLTVESFGRRSNTDRATSYEEGPWFYKRDNLYYMVFAGGPISEHIAYSTSTGPTGPWTYGGVIMPTQGGSFTNHPGVCDFADNSYLFYHNAALPGGGGFHRSVCVEQFSYNADGTFPTINMTETGAPQVGSLNPYDTVQAETICFESGIETETCTEGGMMVTSISEGDYISVKGVDFGVAASMFEVRATSGSSGGSIELRLGSRTGTLIGTCNISATGGWTTWETFQCDITNCTGKNDLYLVFNGSGEPYRLNWYKFGGASGNLLSIQTIGHGTVDRSPNSSSYEEGTSVTLTAQPETGWVFDSWAGEGISGSENPLTITMGTDKTISALFTRGTIDGNLVLNGDFGSGSTDWTLNVWGGSATGSVINGEYQFSIESAGTNNYDIQLVQSGLYLENSTTYEVTFDAYAALNRALEVNVEMANDPWTSYLPELQHFDLTTTKQTFTFRFTMEQSTDVDGRIGFNVGTTTPAVTIDNISVKVFDPTGIFLHKENYKHSAVKLNRSNSSLRIEFEEHGNGPLSLKLYDMKGNVMRSAVFRTKKGNHNFDLTNMSKGFYIINIESTGKTIHSSKVILTK